MSNEIGDSYIYIGCNYFMLRLIDENNKVHYSNGMSTGR